MSISIAWRNLTASAFSILILAGSVVPALATHRVVVGHDINTLGSAVAGVQEATFAVNVADWLTDNSSTKNLLLFESNPGDGHRNFATIVLNALADAGYNVTVTADYAVPYASYDAIFTAENFPEITFLDNEDLITYVEDGGSVYLAGGVGQNPWVESAGWAVFLSSIGLAFDNSYNGLYLVNVTSTHPIFGSITTLGSGNGQSILDLGTNPYTEIVQFQGTEGVYAVFDPGHGFGCDRPWNIRFFGCDAGHENVYELQRDGTPICGSDNCPGEPGSCWGPAISEWNYNGNGVSWNIGNNGELVLSHAQDIQVYGETHLYAEGDTLIQVPVQSEAGRVWLNDTLIPESTSSGVIGLDLIGGWNHLEWTSYNQNQDTSFSLDFPFTNYVSVMVPTESCVALSGVFPGESLVQGAWLGQNSPNPFNPITVIAFEAIRGSRTRLAIFDIAGRLVKVLVDEVVETSGHQEAVWNGRDEYGRVLSAGVYFCRLESGGYVETRRMTMLK